MLCYDATHVALFNIKVQKYGDDWKSGQKHDNMNFTRGETQMIDVNNESKLFRLHLQPGY